MAGSRPLPSHGDLLPYNHAVAGHDGTLSDPDGELFIKPCVQQEIDFYEKAFRDHPEFASLMPCYIGTLELNDATDVNSLNEQLPAVADRLSQGLKEEAVLMAKAAAAKAAAEPAGPHDSIRWKPSRKITTNKSVVLENSTHGFKKPNILDAKLGRRLWADDAPLEKRKKFDELTRTTTTGSHGFRIAGMRVYKGSDNPEELDPDGFRVYDKEYGRCQVNKDNIVQEIGKFIFNDRAGIDKDLGRAIAQAFLEDLMRVEKVLANSETRMYSASLLFTFEGDGEALRAAIEQTNALASDKTEENEIVREGDITHEKLGGIEISGPIEGDIKVIELMGDVAADGEEEEDDELSNLPRIYSLKLIDFAHAEWVPGQGPDENSLFGVRISANRTITLRPFWEWRFHVPHTLSQSSSTAGSGATVRLVSGTAERDGTELAQNREYTFPRNTRSKLLTYTGCTLEASGEFIDNVAQYASPEDSPQLAVLNLHFALQAQRKAAAAKADDGHNKATPGPRVMVCGPANSGKTTVVKTLTALATRMGGQPLVASVDPREGMLSLPGTISAAVFGTMMDVEDPAGGFGVSSTPASGPSAVPVKLPMVYYFGREKVEEDAQLWRDLTSSLASSVRARLAADERVRESGLVLDTPAASVAKGDVDMLMHAVSEFAVNVVVVLGSDEIYGQLQRRLENEKTTHGEAISVVPLSKSDGVAEQDKEFMKVTREAAIKEYFFGDSKRTLSPFTQSVSFDDVAIFKTPDDSDFYDTQQALEPAEISAEMSHWTLAAMNASLNDPPETIRRAPVMGFVAVADVDEDRRRLKILSPVGGRLGNRPMVWGRWPEPYINLLG
ncbi:hypothetical protein C8A03DRAFT_46312 [Achaetomium macrosporum]|uniref:Polynucleotide 5'-hydroxyl-kinase GRC3 n=1 Tax=Achaetomium macrosporum TaxID=79813 RepID=A0AAN7C5G4_9PEZI|nr:hypothetical protein C8A03DRAFT_46312 [Achaetomium macrosporum]